MSSLLPVLLMPPGLRVVVLLALVGLAVAVVQEIRRRLEESDWSREPSETHWAITGDGWELPLYRYKPAEASTQPPVILCHGLGVNGHFMEMPGASLAGALVEAGFDCWVVELRGQSMAGRWPAGGARGDVWFEDLVELDVPALIATVREQTGSGRVSWVGHSMGGMVLFAYLAAGGGFIHRAATIGSTALLRPRQLFRVLFRLGLPLMPHRGLAHQDWLGPLLSVVVSDRWVWPFARPFLAPGHLSLTDLRRFMRRVYAPLAWPLMRQFASWVIGGQPVRQDGRVIPMLPSGESAPDILFVGGSDDWLATPEAIAESAEQWGHGSRYLQLGDSDDPWGHGDVVLSPRVREQLLPELVAHLTGTPSAGGCASPSQRSRQNSAEPAAVS